VSDTDTFQTPDTPSIISVSATEAILDIAQNCSQMWLMRLQSQLCCGFGNIDPLCCGFGCICGPLFKTLVVCFLFLIFRDACDGLIAKLFSLIVIVIEDRRGSNGSMQGFK
jgi:hypothetical protein